MDWVDDLDAGETKLIVRHDVAVIGGSDCRNDCIQTAPGLAA